MLSPERFVNLEGWAGCGGFAVADDLTVLWCSDGGAAALGIPRERLLGRRLGEVIQKPVNVERVAEICRQFAAEGSATVHEMWRGQRWVARVWALDPKALGRGGAMVGVLPGSGGMAYGGVMGFSPFQPSFGDLSVLTMRELEVLRMLADGMSDKAIAADLHRTKSTVETHVASILRKLRVDNRSAATKLACERGVTAFTLEQWAQVLERGSVETVARSGVR